MDFFDKAKQLAEVAKEKLDQAQGLVEQYGGMLPEDRKAQVEGYLQQAQGALGGIAGQAEGFQPGEADAGDSGAIAEPTADGNDGTTDDP